jgi:Protein of unknown function (DUF2905)
LFPLDCSRRRPHLPIEVRQPLQRLLIGLGLAFLLAGIAWPLLSRIGLGRLPGDIVIERGGTNFYFPIATCIFVSIVLTTLMWLFNR